MAKVFQLPEDEYQVQNAKGDILFTAPLLDLFYLIAQSTEVNGLTDDQKFPHAAAVVNAKYGTSFTGGQILSMFVDISESVEAAKKNTSSSQE